MFSCQSYNNLIFKQRCLVSHGTKHIRLTEIKSKYDSVKEVILFNRYEITRNKEGGVISGVQKTENGPIEWSKELPATCRLSL